MSIGPEDLSYAQEDVSGLPAVLEFDAGAVTDQFLNSFFRI